MDSRAEAAVVEHDGFLRDGFPTEGSPMIATGRTVEDLEADQLEDR